MVSWLQFEFAGPPHKSAAIAKKYAECSPSSLVSEWATPTLVIHGGKDYRLTEAEGLATFTALQRQVRGESPLLFHCPILATLSMLA